MKKIYLTLFFLCICLTDVFSQVEIGFVPIAHCAGETYNYSTLQASVQGCTYKWTVVNGKFENGTTTMEGPELLAVNVIWDNVLTEELSNGIFIAPKGYLSVEVSGCNLPEGESPIDDQDNIIILSLNGLTPEEFSSKKTDVPLCANSAITYTIPEVIFPNTGVSDGWSSSIKADSYQWIIPAGW